MNWNQPLTSPSLPPVVSPQFVQESSAVILVDSRWYLDGRRGLDAYQSGHIPGAVFVDMNTELAAPPAPKLGRHPLPTPTAFAKTMSRLGVSETSTVMVYDDCGGQVSARLVWMLRSLGMNAAVLDGGIAAWPGELSTANPSITESDFPVRQWPSDRLVDIEDVSSTTDTLIDARALGRFAGDFEPVDPRAGHIPGAFCMPCSENLTKSGFFRSPSELRVRFAAANITDETQVISYCGSGVTACHNLLALEQAGFDPKNHRLYVGSFSQWSSNPDKDVATGRNRPYGVNP